MMLFIITTKSQLVDGIKKPGNLIDAPVNHDLETNSRAVSIYNLSTYHLLNVFEYI